MHLRLKAVILALMLAVPAVAAANSGELKFDDIRSQQSEIRAGVTARSGRYKDMSANTRTELLHRQTEVLNLIEDKIGPSDLNQDQRTALFNHLEWIEAAINREEDERLICERRTTIGSNRKERVCRTAAQIREERERARNELDQSVRNMRVGN